MSRPMTPSTSDPAADYDPDPGSGTKAARGALTRILRRDVLAVVGSLALMASATGVGMYLNARDVPLHVPAPPLLGTWSPHIGIGTPLAIAVAILVIAYGPPVVARLRWRALLPASWAASLAWVLSCGLVDGWDRLSTRMGQAGEYLNEMPGAQWSDLFADFAGRIPLDSPDNWAVHVAGHPPGALGFFMVLDRIGLSGSATAAVVAILLGTSAVVAIALTLRALGSERVARAALPFLILTPAAIWIGASGDAIFLAFASWGMALLALATRTRGVRRWVAAVASGLLFGCCLYLSYGLVLFGVLVLAVFVISRDWRALALATGGVLAVAAFWTIGGFVWWEAYPILVDRYYAGWGGERPYAYFVWANIGALLYCVGPAIPVGLARLWAWFSWRSWVLLPLAATAAVLTATLSGMSKAEVERIWLPFALWLVPACAAIPPKHRRFWLVVQVVAALLVQHLVQIRW